MLDSSRQLSSRRPLRALPVIDWMAWHTLNVPALQFDRRNQVFVRLEIRKYSAALTSWVALAASRPRWPREARAQKP